MRAVDRGELIEALKASGAVRFGQFTLASGQTSDIYVDIKRAWSDPARLRVMAAALASHVGGADRLAGMELGAVPLIVATALLTGHPYAVVRKAAKAHGTQQRFEGEVPSGARVVVLEDVTTTGGSVVETVQVLRDAGAIVDRVVVVVDREAGARERLAAVGVTLEPLVTLSELRGARS
jgi:orotate phosphoribosyltransferase